MAEYALNVTTGSMLNAGTLANVYITLIGTERESERTLLTRCGLDDRPAMVGTCVLTTLLSIGSLLLLKLEKDPFQEFPDDNWFCANVVVRTPEEEQILFPCYKWLPSGETVWLRGGKATKAFEDVDPRLVEQRKKELFQQKLIYKWDTYADGLSYILNINDPVVVPEDVSFSLSKASQFWSVVEAASQELKLHGLEVSEHWKSFEAMKAVSWFRQSPISEYVSEHWKEDAFFGYQLLNGDGPCVIQRCTKLPSNFPITKEMVKPFLAKGSTLAEEMKKGNIFIIDYKIMEGLPTRMIDCKPLVVAAPLCLLYLNPQKKLLPIAIQLGQHPSEEKVIFLPSDSESDWLLAKTFVRLADALYNEVLSHLQRSHLLAEVFTMATLRNLPMVHPLYKLLIPHHRATPYINILARHVVYGPGRVLANTSLGADGITELLRRGLAQTTYASLCLPDNIAARGLQSIPNFHYRDDSMRLWRIINRFVKAVVTHYYPYDGEVCEDSELQTWVTEIFTYGFLGNAESGLPSSFQTVEELTKFVTMVIFTSSVQHAALNGGQFDFLGWIPNGPMLLYQGPPTTKGQSTMADILLMLPDKSTAGLSMSMKWVLSRKYSDFVPLGNYPDQRFEEPAVLTMIQHFQAELSSLSVAITKRNSGLELPYNYLNPTEIENSVTI